MPSGGKPKTYPPALVERVTALYGAGLSQAEVAAEVGLSQKVIWNLMRRHEISARVAAKRNQRGPLNSSWKGNAAGYHAFHRRLYAMRGKPAQCERCGTTEAAHYDYANLTGNYEDASDYAAMCRSCHSRYDGKIRNIHKAGENARA